MRVAASWIVLMALLGPAGCTATATFACSEDSQCVSGEVGGRCEPEGVCSFPDDACGSGHRFGMHSGELSGECVEGETSSGATTSGSGGATSISLEGTTAADESSAGPSTSSTTSTSTTTTSTTAMTTDPVASTTDDPDPSTTSTTGTVPSDPYGPCVDASDCPDAASSCIVIDGVSACAPPCATAQDCPPLEGAADPMCVPIGGMVDGCVVICNGDADCPPDMVCQPVQMSMIGYCGWSNGP